MAIRLLLLWGISLGLLCGCGPEVQNVSEVSGELPTDVPPVNVTETDWPWWRGTSRKGLANDQQIPTEWGPQTNVVWKSEVPGRGHASPTIVGDRIFLATADEEKQTQSVLAYDRATGKELWRKEVHSGNLPEKGHPKSSYASSTLAGDGERIFAVFLNGGKLHATALDLEGKIVWQESLDRFVPKFGYAASPAIYKSLVIVAGDNQGGGYLTALNRATGDLVWRVKRPNDASFSTPVIAEIEDRDLLVLAGCKQVIAYDPTNGEKIWSVDGTAETAVGTAVWEDNKVVASGGWPEKDTVCINAATGEAVWHVPKDIYVPSLLVHDGYVYAVDNGGVGYCWSLADGQRQWQARVGGNYSSSPVLVGDKILITNESGETVIFEANPEAFNEIGRNKLGDEAFASPVVVGNRIYLRTAHRDGDRQEVLYCIGDTERL
jgi:outer membrane protein assembly factor BamB